MGNSTIKTMKSFIKISLIVGFICIGFSTTSVAQVISENGLGKTYYDENKKQVKEIYHYILEYTFAGSAITDQEKKYEKSEAIKNGPYTCYHPNGKLKQTGYYNRNNKDSVWKYYNTKGILIKTEKYRNLALVKE
jgi:antitoxin component YwqK of YwqJK toxin-antitoxin module